MAWAGIVPSRGWSLKEWADYVANAEFLPWPRGWPSGRPSGLTLHNTGAPNLTQWDGFDEAQRIQNLQTFYRDEQGWQSAPHAFVDGDEPCVWPFTPITMPGTHSPSWNRTRIGIEMAGDYRPGVDDPTKGRGRIVYQNMVAVFGILCLKLELEPNDETIKFHREDPRTTHRCPGDLMFNLKSDFIQDVQEYLMAGGDHPLDKNEIAPPNSVPPERRAPKEGIVNVSEGLNLREGASTSFDKISLIPFGTRIALLGEPVLNGRTEWRRVWYRDAEGTARVGWVAARYVDIA